MVSVTGLAVCRRAARPCSERSRRRTREEKALPAMAILLSEEIELLGGLYAFRGDVDFQRLTERHDRAGDRHIVVVVRQIADEGGLS